MLKKRTDIMGRYTFVFLIFPLLLLKNGTDCIAQNCLDTVLSADMYTRNSELINGTKWTYDKRYNGSPLLFSDDWPEADLNYNDRIYERQQINYDLFNNKLILSTRFYGQAMFLILNDESFAGFSYNDKQAGLKHMYEYRSLNGRDERYLYENFSIGQISIYVRPLVRIEMQNGGNSRGRYVSYYEYYFSNGNGFSRISSGKQLLAFFSDRTTELKRFIRRSGLKINERNPMAVIEVLKYYSTLK